MDQLAAFESTIAFEDVTNALPKLSDEWRIVSLYSLDGIPKHFCHVIGICTARQHVHGKCIPKSMRVSIGHVGPLPEGDHSLVQSWPGKQSASERIQQNAVSGLWVSQVPPRFQSEKQFAVKGQDNFFAPLEGYPFDFLPIKVDFPPRQ